MKFLVFFFNGLIEIKENDVSLIKKLACAVLTWTLRSLGLTGREGGGGGVRTENGRRIPQPAKLSLPQDAPPALCCVVSPDGCALLFNEELVYRQRWPVRSSE